MVGFLHAGRETDVEVFKKKQSEADPFGSSGSSSWRED